MDVRKVILTQTISESTRRFSELIEKERTKRDLSQKEMAKALNISLSSYRRIVSGESLSIPMEMIINVHRLTGMWLYQMLGESNEHTATLDKYMLLDSEDQEMVRTLVYHLWRKSNGII